MPGSMSGVVVGDDVKKVVEELLKNKKHQFVVFKLGKNEDDGKDSWKIAAVGDRKGSKKDVMDGYKGFVSEHLGTDAVFALYDYSQLKVQKVNVVGLQWCPDTLGVSAKMKFASSVDPLKKLCEASTKIFAQNERDEVEPKTILKSYGLSQKDVDDIVDGDE